LAIKYLDAKRLQGTNAERLAMSTSLSTFSTTSEPADAGRGIQQGGIRQEIAQQYNTGHVLEDEPIVSASFFLRGVSSPAGNVRAFIREADGTEVQESSTVLDSGTTTGSSVEYTFNFPNTVLGTDEMITVSGVDMTNGSLDVMTSATGMTDGTLYSNNAGTYTELTDEQIRTNVIYGTAVYPDLPNGTIFNETDTYKYFMFDGTDTWNQMVSS